MQIIKGSSISEGISIGKLSFYREPWRNGDYASVADVDKEIGRLDKAIEAARKYLEEIRAKAVAEVGDATATIFSAHQVMLEDPEYTGMMKNIIRDESMNCEYALHKVSRFYRNIFNSMDDEYMRSRVEDVNSLEKYIWNNLGEVNETVYQEQEPRILVSEEFVAGEMIRLDKSRVLGFIARRGAYSGHSGILARNMGIPAVFQVEELPIESLNGHTAIIDGYSGEIYIDPDAETLKRLSLLKKQKDISEHSLEDNFGEVAVTGDGRCVYLYSNIGIMEDLYLDATKKSGGIGLFRTEFLFSVSSDFPSEEVQYQAYKKAAECMNGKPVTVRTLDISCDKKLPYMDMADEINPELGIRGVRYSLKHPDIFKVQLRALLRASAHGNIRIMYPMITSVSEVERAAFLLEEAKNELTAEGLSYDSQIKVGIMIETPSAAIMSHELAEKVDFFSIGSNDLTQYTMAADRQNEELSHYFTQDNPAVMKLIEMVAINGRERGIPVGICGEIAGEPSLVKTFVDMGITGLSMAPARIPEVYNAVCLIGKSENYAKCN